MRIVILSLALALSGCIYPKSLFEVGFIAGRAGAATLVQRIPPQGALKKDEPQTFACFLEEQSQKMSLRHRVIFASRWHFLVISAVIKWADVILNSAQCEPQKHPLSSLWV